MEFIEFKQYSFDTCIIILLSSINHSIGVLNFMIYWIQIVNRCR